MSYANNAEPGCVAMTNIKKKPMREEGSVTMPTARNNTQARDGRRSRERHSNDGVTWKRVRIVLLVKTKLCFFLCVYFHPHLV